MLRGGGAGQEGDDQHDRIAADVLCGACDRRLAGQVADRLRKIGLEIGEIARLQALRRELPRNAPVSAARLCAGCVANNPPSG
jgi:hypothetical protein